MTNKRDKGAPEQGVSLDDASISKIASEIRRQDRRRHTRRNLMDVLFKDVLTVRDDLQLHHKIFYVFLVFFGMVLVWYGVWGIIAVFPVLKNPIIALFAGVAVLFFTGTFYRRLG